MTTRVMISCVLAGMMLWTVSCSPTLVGPDSAAYSATKLHASISRPMDAVYDAALSAVGKLGLTVDQKAKDVFSGRIVATSADAKKVFIVMSPEGDKGTRMTIQFGTMGDQHRSQAIYDEIKRNLTGSK